jgi:2-polyprenyl-3-methyl-5-hydroxy-6-metoxy-1,4-benzoquinol methylase
MKPLTIAHHGKTVVFATTTQEYQRRWCQELALPGHQSLVESSLWELQQRFPERTTEAIRGIWERAGQLFADHWHQSRVNSSSEQSVVAFYNSTDLEIVELMEWHASVETGRLEEPSYGPLNYLVTLEVAKACGWRRSYLDFGSGIGSSAILFAKAGWDVTLADVSTPLLQFARQRLERRGLRATYVDLKTERLPSDRFDVVTCFDVIEHTVKPLDTLRQIRRALKPGGYLVLNNADDVIAHEDAERPMHIMHDRHLWKRLRGLGFEMDRWQLPKAWMRVNGQAVYVLRKVERPALTNRLIGFYDARVPDAVKERLQWAKRLGRRLVVR